MTADKTDAESPMRFGYFVLQTQAARTPDRTVRLFLENLGTGEKLTFASSAELKRFLDEWGGVAVGDDRFRAPTARAEEA